MAERCEGTFQQVPFGQRRSECNVCGHIAIPWPGQNVDYHPPHLAPEEYDDIPVGYYLRDTPDGEELVKMTPSDWQRVRELKQLGEEVTKT